MCYFEGELQPTELDELVTFLESPAPVLFAARG
jgi:hypothetical protein